MLKPIYLDYNATTPHAPEVITAMRPYLEEEFGNPSSSHFYGTMPQKAVAEARLQVAGLLGCRAKEILFTSGGTENVLEIFGLGKACEIAARDLDQNMTHMQHMRDRLYEGIKSKCADIRVNGHLQERLPNTLSISFEGLEANRILERIATEVAASAGAACHSDSIEVSGVLKAMKVPLSWAKGSLRLTTGRMTTEADIDRAVEVIHRAVDSLRD